MKDYKRKDKLFITFIAFACLIMVIANPENYDIRDLAWNYSLMLLLFSAIFWIISEIGDLVSSFTFRFNSYDGHDNVKRSMSDLDDLTHEQLLSLASVYSNGDVNLSTLTDDELAAFIVANSGISNGNKSKLNMLVRIYKILKFVYLNLVIAFVKVYRFFKELPEIIKQRGNINRKPFDLNKIVEQRDMLFRELNDKRE